MLGQRTRLDPLESRKVLLISESEINRAQLSREWKTTAQELHGLAQRAKAVTAWAAAAALLLAGVTAFSSGSSAHKALKRPWLNKILRGVRLVSTIWLALPNRSHKPVPPEP